MHWIDVKYISLLSNKLERFKRKSDKLWNFRCPLCNDSATNKSKARGFIYPKGDRHIFYCHNCYTTMGFSNFLKNIDPQLHIEYSQEKFLAKEDEKIEVIEPFRIVVESTVLSPLKKISSLSHRHPAKTYITKRMIPNIFHSKLYFCSKFKEFVNSVYPKKFETTDNDEPRLIIPIIDRLDKLVGFQGRCFKTNTKMRYITVMLDKTKPRLFGLDRVDLNKKVYVTEGPFDSMFINNSLAVAGGHIIRELASLCIDKDKIIVVYDNEPRNPDIVRGMQSAIDAGYSICIFPDCIMEKDINDMVMQRPLDNIQELIDSNTYYGLTASLKLSQWKKT